MNHILKDNNIDIVLANLSKSKFRSSFHLKISDIKYIKEKGLNKVKEHAISFIDKRLSPKIILNDGRQTPMKGHPVFIAQHATATCCRNCLFKWHKIDKNNDLSENEKLFILNLIMKWIENNIR